MATKQYFELGEKFWEVWIDGSDLYTRHGKIGSSGQVKIKNLASAADAKAQQTKVIADKAKEGYAKGKAAAAPATVEVPKGTQRLELDDGKSRKFWQIHRHEGVVTVTFGKLGSAGQTQTKKYPNAYDAQTAVEAQLAEKKKKGYQLVLTGKQAPASPSATNPALEKAILASPDSDDGFMVYADWLQQQGDVRGELAVIQARRAASPKDKKLRAAEQKLLWDQRAHFWGPLAVYVEKHSSLPMENGAIAATWRQGFIDVLELSAHDSWSDKDAPSVPKAEELIRQLPNVPSAKFLRELTIAKPVVNDEYAFANSIKALIAVLPSLPMLRRLTLGKFSYEDSELSWSHLGNLDALWPLAKQLEYLKIKAGSMTLGKIDAPKLRELRIETGGLDRKAIAAIVTARLPALETLNVWFGQANYGFNGKLADLLPFLDKKQFPKVKHLGVANTVFGDELAEHWPTATILPQLATLDLSKSHLTVAGMRKLAAHRDAFAHLASLDVSNCLLDKEGVKLAKTLCKTVVVTDQSDPADYTNEDEDDEDDELFWRYTAVGE